jgi:Uma2 family endonuclease
MALTQRRMTVEEFLALPPEESPLTQLIDGEIVRTQPNLRHQRITLQLAHILASWLDAHPGSGEAGIGCDIVLDEYNLFVPDVWFVTEAHRLGRDARYFEAPPDLVAEVRLPSTWRYDSAPSGPLTGGRASPSCGCSTPRATRWS